MKLVILTAVWKRPKVFGYFKTFFERARKDFKGRLEVECVVVGSEGKASQGLCNSPGMYYIEYPNQPLYKKWNVGAVQAGELGADYVLCMGSDDIFCTDLLEEYYKLMAQGIDYICLQDCYFYDVRKKKGIYWAGYQGKRHRRESAGIGRCVSKSLATKMGWKFWEQGYDLVLDTGFDVKIARINHSMEKISCRAINALALDIKSPVNMTPFAEWPGAGPCDAKAMLYTYLPKKEADKIYNYD